MTAADWAQAIGATLNEDGVPTAASIAQYMRAAIRATGTLRRTQITRGLTEAFAPLGIEAGALRSAVDEALQTLLLLGDLTALSTASGPAYLLTPPRLVVVDRDRAVMLGASDVEGDGSQVARRLAVRDWPQEGDVPRVDLASEFGVADWRIHLVEIGGVDVPQGRAVALFEHLTRLSAGGERIADLSADKVRVLSGRQPYFGQWDGAHPQGRWRPAGANGTFCAVRHAGYRWRPGVMSLDDGRASVWETDDWDLWRWAIIGQTQLSGDPVYSFDTTTGAFAALVPLPRQARRLMALGAEPTGAWRWRCSSELAAVAEETLAGVSY